MFLSFFLSSPSDFKADKPIKWKDFSGRTFDKLEESYMTKLAEKLKPMIEKAVQMAAKKF